MNIAIKLYIKNRNDELFIKQKNTKEVGDLVEGSVKR